MAKNFPPDEFDLVTGVGGRHRARVTAGSRILSFVRYAGASVVLAAVGIVGLQVVSGSNTFTDVVTGTTTAGQAGFNANGIAVTVVDATTRYGLATKVAHQLYDAGWNVITAVNYSLLPKLSQTGGVITGTIPGAVVPSTAPSASPSASSTPSAVAIGAKTVIYVTTDAAKSAANDLMRTLGSYMVVQANNYSDPITVILGSDYK